jgi:hypothetical protein
MPFCGCGKRAGGKAVADVVEPGPASAAAAVKAPEPGAPVSDAPASEAPPASSAQDGAAQDANIQSAERVLNYVLDATLPYVRAAMGYMIVAVSDRDGRGDASGIPLGPTEWLQDEAYVLAPAARLIIRKKDADGDGASDIDPRTAVQQLDVELLHSRLIRSPVGESRNGMRVPRWRRLRNGTQGRKWRRSRNGARGRKWRRFRNGTEVSTWNARPEDDAGGERGTVCVLWV